MVIFRALNLGLAFFLELILLASFGFFGYVVAKDTVWQWPLAITLPTTTSVFWGVFLSPKAARRVAPVMKIVLKVILFALGVVALLATGRITSALVFGALAALNLTLLSVWRENKDTTAQDFRRGTYRNKGHHRFRANHFRSPLTGPILPRRVMDAPTLFSHLNLASLSELEISTITTEPSLSRYVNTVTKQ